MRKWYAFPEIQAEGCLVLAIAADNNDDFNKSAEGTKALDATIWAMMNYPDNSRLQDCGCIALANFVLVKGNAVHVVKNNVVELVLTAMNTFKENVHVQTDGSYFLAHLLSWKDGEIKEAILEASGDAQQALFNAIKTHNDESKSARVKDLQTQARSALKKLL